MIGRRILLGLAVALTTTSAALAQFPDKPITILVGFAPGGTSDVSARILTLPEMFA